MQNKFASLCVLAYKRPEQLKSCMKSLKETTNYPHEIIVNVDASEGDNNQSFMVDLLLEKKISKLLLNNGENRGVGRSFANCVGVAEGDYIVKIDTDLTFTHGWLSQAIGILESNTDIGAVSLFNYRNYDANDTRFNIIETRSNCHIVDDFVSSIYVFSKDHLRDTSNWMNDDGFHSYIQSKGLKLAITLTDYTSNSGFGVTKSTYVSGTEDHPYKTPTHNEPLLFSNK